MATNRSEKIRIGIVGCDSFHTPALSNQFLLRDDCEIVWIDKTLRSNLAFSKERQPRLESMIHPSLTLTEIDLLHHDPVDVYCILNVDSHHHLSILNTLSKMGKPIFVDKPMFDNLESFVNLPDVPMLSCSGFRFCDFLKTDKKSGHIKIYGPLSFVDGIRGYFWYGIHHIEMLHTLTRSRIELSSLEICDRGHTVRGTSGNFTFEIFGQTVDDLMFGYEIDNQRYELKSYDDLYRSLADGIIKFAKNPTTSINNTQEVIRAVLYLNDLLR